MTFAIVFAWGLGLSFTVFLLGYGIRSVFYVMDPVDVVADDDLD